MKFMHIDHDTAGTFFRCLHDEKPADPRVIALRRRWYNRYKDKGLRAKVLVRDDDAIVGLCQYLPIEHSFLRGNNLFAILCMWVHGYEHRVGNQQGQGYGAFVLHHIEEDARVSGAKGVAAWGMDFPFWNPVSFYEHMGYTRVEKQPPVILVWKPFTTDATPPTLLQPAPLPEPETETTNVTMFINGWCGSGCEHCVAARDVVAELGDMVSYTEIDTSDRTTMEVWGIDDGLFLDGTPFRPNGPPWTREELSAEIRKRSEERNDKQGERFSSSR